MASGFKMADAYVEVTADTSKAEKEASGLGAKIGKGCIIGAQALIGEGKEIPDYSLVVGSPGKVVRQLDEAQRQMLLLSAQHYVENAKRFQRELIAQE